jgi:multiple sugar transport system substrate-binding protein
MKRFSEQAAVLSPEMAKLQSLPQFGAIAQVLTDQLDLCWSGQQAPQATAKSISDGVKRALAA